MPAYEDPLITITSILYATLALGTVTLAFLATRADPTDRAVSAELKAIADNVPFDDTAYT